MTRDPDRALLSNLVAESEHIDLVNQGETRPLNRQERRSAIGKIIENERYAGREQEIGIFVDLPGFLRTISLYASLDAGASKADLKKRPPISSLTEFQYLLSDYLIKNQDDKEYLEKFWDQLKGLWEDVNAEFTQMDPKTGEAHSHPVSFENYKKGFLSQAATYNMLEKLGLNPTLATPKEDAYQMTDMRIFKGESVQIKSGRELALIPVQEFGVPASIYNKDGREVILSASQQGAVTEERHLLGALAEKGVAYLLVMPESCYDPVTAEVRESCADKLGAQLEALSLARTETV